MNGSSGPTPEAGTAGVEAEAEAAGRSGPAGTTSAVTEAGDDSTAGRELASPDRRQAVTEELGAAEALARARAAARAKGLRPSRGGPGRRRPPSGEGSDRDGTAARDPQLIGDVLGRLSSNRGWQTELAVGSIMGRWPVIVGIEVSRHCRPERFDQGVLTLRAESSAWAAQLRTLSTTVLELIEREVGAGVVHELRILGPGGPSWRRGRLRVRGPGPRDTYG